jgi:carboxymethylenebutenolidase
MPGWDEATREITRRFAAHGYAAICPNLHYRVGPDASPDDAAAAVRAKGGVTDEQFLGDAAGALRYLRSLPYLNGRVGVIGYCSGGRQSFLAACTLQVDAAVDCYGALVATAPAPGFPLQVRPIVHLAGDLRCPLLGLFGEEDRMPAPAETADIAAALERAGKTFEFHTYPDAGHAFFATDRPSYRVAAANDGWRRIWEWFGRHLAA